MIWRARVAQGICSLSRIMGCGSLGGAMYLTGEGLIIGSNFIDDLGKYFPCKIGVVAVIVGLLLVTSLTSLESLGAVGTGGLGSSGDNEVVKVVSGLLGGIGNLLVGTNGFTIGGTSKTGRATGLLGSD